MLDTPCFEVVWRVLAIHSIRQFLLHFLSRASPCANTFQLDSTAVWNLMREQWGSPFVEGEKYQEEKTCDKARNDDGGDDKQNR